MLQTLRRKLAASRKPAKMHNRARLGLEILEDRCLLSTMIAEFPVTGGSAPIAIASAPDGNVWFTEATANQIGMMNPMTHAITEYSIPTANSGPNGITAGPDGNLWFTEASANRIGCINPTTGAISEYAIPTAGSGPTSIVAGPDGNLWFTEANTSKIGVISPSTHAVADYAIPTSNSAPAGIAAGPDGNLWFSEANANKIGAINPIAHTFAEYAIPTGSSQPQGITAGPDGNIWFTEAKGNRIGQINPTTHAVSEFVIPTGSSGPVAITAASDGNLWFTESNGNQIGTLYLPSNTIMVINIPTAKSAPAGISVGAGGTLWFAESGANQIGEVIATPLVTATPVNQTVVEGQTATFIAAATVGFPTPSVVWQVSTNGGLTFTPLANGGVYSGVTTGTLTITGATLAMTGYQYEALFSNGVSPTPSVATAPATLTVNSMLSLNPSPTPQGVIGMNYNQTLSVMGSTSAFTLFAVNNFNAGGTGLTAANISTNTNNGTITITGTPTGVGTATFTFAVANAGGHSLTQNLSIIINPPLSIATASLPQATAGTPYNQNISVIGGAMPYTTFTVTNWNGGTTGLIPAAISTIPPLGIFNLSAIPPAAGTATFTINVTDSMGTTVTKNYTITVNAALAITPSLPQGTAGTNYNQTLTVTGGGVPYTSLAVTSFNGGTTGLTVGNITMNAGAGTFLINGTPTATGTATFTVNVIDLIGASLTRTYTVKVNPALAITLSLPQGTAGAAYSQTIMVAGGSTPYPTFTVSGFNAGTTGFTAAAVAANQATSTIAIAGTPTAAGMLAFTVNVTDAAGAVLTKTYNITINAALSVADLTTTQWTAGLAGFTGKFVVSGGTSPLTITGVNGIPTGMGIYLDSGNNTVGFYGTPSAPGTFAGSISFRDAAGANVTKAFSITINPALAVSGLSAIQWTIGRSGFNGIMTLAGGTGGLSIVGSTGIPTGLAIGQVGNTIAFTGTPTVVGTFGGSVTVRDGLGATFTRSFGITINALPTISNLTMTQWTSGKSGFTGALAVIGGTTPHTITAQSGLPTGLTAVVNGATISFIGTPTTPGTYNGSITIVDTAGASVTKTFSITINPPVVIVTASVPKSRMGVLYSASVAATGGTGAIIYTLTAGSLPPGYRLNANGTITGLSRGIGSFTFTATATDAVGAVFSKTFTLTISRF